MAPAALAPRLRLDKSKPHSHIYGDRPVGDPHYGIHFFQDGLPFDSQYRFVTGYFNDENDSDGKLRELAERRLRKQAGNQTPADEEAEEGEAGGGDDGDVITAEDVNLEAWATGEANYLFGLVRSAIKKRYAQVVKDQKSAIECLIDEHLVTEEQLAPTFKKLLG